MYRIEIHSLERWPKPLCKNRFGAERSRRVSQAAVRARTLSRIQFTDTLRALLVPNSEEDIDAEGLLYGADIAD